MHRMRILALPSLYAVALASLPGGDRQRLPNHAAVEGSRFIFGAPSDCLFHNLRKATVTAKTVDTNGGIGNAMAAEIAVKAWCFVVEVCTT